jgi:hypothetical protein
MTIQLKIKSKHLAAESRIIKHEECKLKNRIKLKPLNEKSLVQSLNSLASHRKGIVRSAARSTHLAYGFLRKTSYRRIEDNRTRTEPNWKEIERMVVKYGGEDQRLIKQRFAEWKESA